MQGELGSGGVVFLAYREDVQPHSDRTYYLLTYLVRRPGCIKGHFKPLRLGQLQRKHILGRYQQSFAWLRPQHHENPVDRSLVVGIDHSLC